MDVNSIINEYKDKNNLIIEDDNFSIAINSNVSEFKKVNFNKYELLLDDFYYNIFKSCNKFEYSEEIINDYHYLVLKNNVSKMNDLESYELGIKKSDILIKANKYNKPKLLLHSCCGPCSSFCLVSLAKYFDITILYYNPNIYPESEYLKRVETQKQIINDLGLNIYLIIIDYDHRSYLNAIKDYKDYSYKEGSKRCYECYKERMTFLAEFCKDNNFDFFTTTLSISPYKNSEWINEIGISLEKELGVNYLYSDFKKNNGYIESIKLSKKYNLYRQEYCGCEYSLKEKKEE